MKARIGKKGLLHLTPPTSQLSLRDVGEGTQKGRNLEAEPEAGAMEEHCYWLAKPASSHHPISPAQVQHHPQWPGPSFTNH